MKVFGIGLNKTGTTTLGLCLKHLGFDHATCNLEMARHVARGDLEPVFAFVERHESFEDWPWPLIYRELDERFPGSRFVLTTRKDADTWLGSLKRHAVLTGPTELREIAYGYAMPHGRETEHIGVYERHNREVRRYFRDRPADFVELCWETGSGWTELCALLNVDVPEIPLPHANRSSSKRFRIAWRSARHALTKAFRRGA